MISLSIRGLAFCDPLDVKLPNHAALLGKNGSGKTTILNAIRLMATGECGIEGVGNVPGSFLALARPNATVEIAIEVDGIGATATIAKRGQRDLKARLFGFDCRLANIAMKGSAEDVRKFLAANVRPSPEWTREKAREEIARRNAGSAPTLNPAPSIIDSLNLALAAQKEESKRRREAARSAKATTAGANQEAARADAQQVTRSYDDVRAAADALRAERAALAKERAQLAEANNRWRQAKKAVEDARTAADEAHRRAQTLFVNPIEVDAARDAMLVAEKESERLTTLVETLDTTEAMEREGAEAAQLEVQRLEGEVAALQARVGAILNDKTACPTCEQPIGPELYDAMRATLQRTQSNAFAAREAATIANNRYLAAKADANDARVKLAATQRALAKAKETTEAFARRLTERDHAERVGADLERVVAGARQALDALAIPPTPEDLDAREREITQKVVAIEDEIRVHDARRHARALAAKAEADATNAQDLLTASLVTEEAIRAVRDAITQEAVAPLAAALEKVARVLGDAPVVDLGDEERDPTIGIRRGDDVIGFQVLSGGERAMFLACLSAALMEQSQAPPERRILLLEAAELDKQHLRAMLDLLKGTNIGHTVVAHPTDEAGDLAVLLARGFVTVDATPTHEVAEASR